MQTAVVRHWFNPLVWLAARAARANCEWACDEFVLRREVEGGGDGEAYGATLLKVLGLVGERRRPLAVVGISENRRRLAERVRMIAGFRRGGSVRVAAGVALVVPVAVASAPCESRAAKPAVGTEPQATPPNEREAAAAQERARVKEVRATIEQSRINRVAVDFPE